MLGNSSIWSHCYLFSCKVCECNPAAPCTQLSSLSGKVCSPTFARSCSIAKVTYHPDDLINLSFKYYLFSFIISCRIRSDLGLKCPIMHSNCGYRASPSPKCLWVSISAWNQPELPSLALTLDTPSYFWPLFKYLTTLTGNLLTKNTL